MRRATTQIMGGIPFYRSTGRLSTGKEGKQRLGQMGPREAMLPRERKGKGAAVTRRTSPLWEAASIALCLACLVCIGHAEDVEGQGAHHLWLFDLRYTLTLEPAAAYEETHLYSALAGLVNRDGPLLYTLYNDGVDEQWLDYMTQRPFLRNATVSKATSLDQLLTLFQHKYKGVVVYDPLVPATSNVASTAAGALDLLPIPHRPQDPSSLYSRYVSSARLPVSLDLAGRFNGSISGSTKCDAYLWALENLLEPGLTNSELLAYFVDYYWVKVPMGSGKQGVGPDFRSSSVVNHDYFISNKAFFFDLSVWDDETPNDDPSQPLGADLRTLLAILQAHYDATQGQRIITVGGFTPWLYKYVGWGHEGVETEWQTAAILSAYNTIIDADACCIGAMANAALYTHYPLPERLVQNPAPTPQWLMERGLLTRDPVTLQYSVPTAGYYAFYVGDYDSAAWMYSQLWSKWEDPVRGQVPLGWAWNPNLSKRFPLIWEHAYATLSPNDRITTGDSGPGYVNPTMLFEPRLYSNAPSGAQVWREWCVRHYNRFGMTFTGFLLNGKAGHMNHQTQQFYSEFSYDGMTNHHGYSPDYPQVPSLEGNSPVFEEMDVPGGDIAAATHIMTERYASSGGASQFMIFRSILQSPSYHLALVENVTGVSNGSLVVVDPLTLGYLSRIHLGGHNNDRVQYIHDTLPRTLHMRHSPRGALQVGFSVRNNGWNVLNSSPDTTSTVDAFVTLRGSLGGVPFVGMCEGDIAPGEEGVFTAQVTVPEEAGKHELVYGLWRGDGEGGDFSYTGNPKYSVTITVLGGGGQGKAAQKKMLR